MNKIVFVAFLLGILACNAPKEVKKYRVENDGLIIEKFDSLGVGKLKKNSESKQVSYIEIDDNRYNYDNTIYKAGRKFVFRYFHVNLKGDTLLFKNSNKENFSGWQFERKSKRDSTIIYKHVMKIKSGLGSFKNQIPEYFQTVFSNEYLLQNGNSIGNESSGIIENPKNVWMHPPRLWFFKSLEINPFPYIKAPFKIGNKWNWSLEIGEWWADKRWILWEGAIENKYNYQIVDKIKLKTSLGNLSCYVVDGQAHSRIGKTYLKSYFNEQFGFIKLDYTNIDGTKTIIELEKVE